MNNKRKPGFSTAVAVAAVLAVSAAFGGVRVERGIAYAADDADQYRRERCKLDVKVPDNKKGFATVVWFHGGGLEGGGRHFINIGEDIAQVAVDYRLLSHKGVQGRDCVADAAAAVAWTLSHIAEYGGDANKVYVSGFSAGGYLTMMVGMAPEYLEKHGYKLSALAGLIPMSGQATKHYNVRKYAGDDDPQYRPKIDDLAPLRWVSKDIPPILSVCGEPPWEWPARSEENRLLIASCKALGHKKAFFAMMPFCDHGRTYDAGVPYVEMFVRGRIPGQK